jgi:hypothetical protein
MKVYWNPEVKNPYTGKAVLCNARADGDGRFGDIIHNCSIRNMLYRQMKEDEQAKANFITSVRPETAKAILELEEEKKEGRGE